MRQIPVIVITIEAADKYSLHKLIVTPSVVVNPPAFQYVKGVKRDFDFATKQMGEIDERLELLIPEVVNMLSSKTYPNSPICCERRAKQIARKYLPELLKKIDKQQTASVEIK